MSEKKKQYMKIFQNRNSGILIGLFLMLIIFSILNPRFFSMNNAINIIRQVSLNGIMACGMTCVIVCGGIDLSIGSIYALSGMMTGCFMLKGVTPALAVLVGLVIGVVFGLVNGIVVTKLKVPPMIATLGTQFAGRGLAMILTDGGIVNLKTIVRTRPDIASFLDLGSGKILDVFPNMALLFIIVVVVMYVLYHKTLLGFNMRAVGGNESAARVSGINSNLVIISSYIIMGFLAALAGITNIAYLKSVQGTMGESIEMDIIAASIIGGTSLTGGEGTIVGTIIGVLIMGVLKTGLVYIGITSYLQNVFIGCIIIAAVAIDMLTKKKR